jgi:glutamyl-tRNA synthetase
VGNARTALLAWLQARSIGAAFILRMEDIDVPRVVPGAEDKILEDLRWLGLDWDEGPDVGGPFGPYRQSERTALFVEAQDRLLQEQRAYPCTCSRAEVQRASSAPHGPQDDGPRYPGTCRNGPGAPGRKPAIRFRVEEGPLTFVDGFHGPQSFDVAGSVGDFVIRRADGLFAYQLAVAVDDARMGITHVLRADDLLTSTPRQILLLQALGKPVPSYFHVPLVVGADGQRLQKRDRGITIASLREQGASAAAVIGALAAISDLAPVGSRLMPKDLIAGFNLSRVPKEPARWTGIASL